MSGGTDRGARIRRRRQRTAGAIRRWLRTTIAGTAVLGTVVAMGIMGQHGGYPASRPRLTSGAAWLASSQVGQLALLDGSSAELAAQIEVAKPGDRLEVVQQGS